MTIDEIIDQKIRRGMPFDTVRIGYFRIPTEKGEGVACCAVQRLDAPAGDIYRAAFSFCSPLDRNRFSKRRARVQAATRLLETHRRSHRRWCFSFTGPVGGYATLRECFEDALLWQVKRATSAIYEPDLVPGGPALVGPDWLARSARQSAMLVGPRGKFLFGLRDRPGSEKSRGRTAIGGETIEIPGKAP